MLNKKFLFGVGITDATNEEILEYILQSLQKSAEKYYVVTPNPEILVYANKHPGFKSILNNARLALCDGVGVIWGGRVLGKTFKERFTGTDLLENLCRRVVKQPITVGFLGGGPKIAERTAECLVKKYPGLKVVFAASEWPEETSPKQKILRDEDIKILSKGEKKLPSILVSQYPNIDLLFVAFGFPKQEEWMAANLNKGIFRVAIGVGGAFDYISGRVKRAPKVIRAIGLEWLYRLIRQPWRAKRQLALLKFILLVLREKFLK